MESKTPNVGLLGRAPLCRGILARKALEATSAKVWVLEATCKGAGGDSNGQPAGSRIAHK